MLDGFPKETPEDLPTKRSVELEGFVSEAEVPRAQRAQAIPFVRTPPPPEPVWRRRPPYPVPEPSSRQVGRRGLALPTFRLPAPVLTRPWIARSAVALAVVAVVAGAMSARHNLAPQTEVSLPPVTTPPAPNPGPVASNAPVLSADANVAPTAPRNAKGTAGTTVPTYALSKPVAAPLAPALRASRNKPQPPAAARNAIASATRDQAKPVSPSAARRGPQESAPAPMPAAVPAAPATVLRGTVAAAPRENTASAAPVTVAPAAIPSAPAVAPSAAAVAPNRIPDAVSRNTVSDEPAIRGVLSRYQAAYERLDASAAKEIWPSVNERALARAFSGLESQSMTFDRCRISVASESALASCQGNASYVGRVGSKSAQAQNREWTFRLRKSGDTWQIDSVQLN